jgi:hypothetical protein
MAQVTFDFITEPLSGTQYSGIISTFWHQGTAWALQSVEARSVSLGSFQIDAGLIRAWSTRLDRVPQIKDAFGMETAPYWRRTTMRRSIP